MPEHDDDMPAEIDFSKGARGKFFNPDTTPKLPIYLDPDVEAYLTARAAACGVDIDHFANEPFKRKIEFAKIMG